MDEEKKKWLIDRFGLVLATRIIARAAKKSADRTALGIEVKEGNGSDAFAIGFTDVGLHLLDTKTGRKADEDDGDLADLSLEAVRKFLDRMTQRINDKVLTLARRLDALEGDSKSLGNPYMSRAQLMAPPSRASGTKQEAYMSKSNDEHPLDRMGRERREAEAEAGLEGASLHDKFFASRIVDAELKEEERLETAAAVRKLADTILAAAARQAK